MKCLCIASNRPDRLREFFHAWREAGDWDCVYLVEGAPLGELDCPWPLMRYSRELIEYELKQNAWIISQGDTACVSFAFLRAAGCGAEWILKLDDDCLPSGPRPICAWHAETLRRPVCRSTVNGLRVRGLPYRNQGQLQALLSMGLWDGVPDLGAAEALDTQDWRFIAPTVPRLANPHERYPLCGMHLYFHVSLLPALFFGLQGEGWPYRRFDDIWAGWIFQKLATHLRVPWTIGGPIVEHSRASDPFKNLVAEAPGISLNETLWQRIDSIELSAGDVAGCAAQIAADLARDGDAYLRDLGRALVEWVDLCRGSA